MANSYSHAGTLPLPEPLWLRRTDGGQVALPVLPALQASFWYFGTRCVNKRAVWQVQASAWLLDVDQMETSINRNAKYYIPSKGHSSSPKLPVRLLVG